MDAQVSTEGSANPESLRNLTVIVALVTTIAASFLGFWATYFSFSYCFPPDLPPGGGVGVAVAFMTVFIWFIAAPLAVLLGLILAYGTVRWFKFDGRKSYAILAGIASGAFSVLLFTLISMAVVRFALCA